MPQFDFFTRQYLGSSLASIVDYGSILKVEFSETQRVTGRITSFRYFDVLDPMGAAFELAQSVDKNAEAKRDTDRLAKREARISIVVVDLFGANPDPKAGAAFTADLAKFDRQLGGYVKFHRNTDQSLIDTNGSTSEIPSLAHQAKSKATKDLARLVAIARRDMSPKGH